MRNFKFFLKIFHYIKEGYSPALIAKKLGINCANIYHYINFGLRNKYIKKVKRGKYIITPLGERFLAKLKNLIKNSIRYGRSLNEDDYIILPYTRIHRFLIKVPIISRNPQLDEIMRWDRQIKYPNRIDRIKKFERYSFTLRDTGKHAIFYLHEFEAAGVNDAYTKICQAILDIETVLYTYGYNFDRKGIKVIQQHCSHKVNKKIKEFINETIGEDVTADFELNKRAKSVFPTTFNAKIWVDRSTGELEVEHNDLEYLEDVCFSPVRIKEILRKVTEIEKMLKDLYGYKCNYQKKDEVENA